MAKLTVGRTLKIKRTLVPQLNGQGEGQSFTVEQEFVIDGTIDLESPAGQSEYERLYKAAVKAVESNTQRYYKELVSGQYNPTTTSPQGEGAQVASAAPRPTPPQPAPSTVRPAVTPPSPSAPPTRPTTAPTGATGNQTRMMNTRPPEPVDDDNDDDFEIEEDDEPTRQAPRPSAGWPRAPLRTPTSSAPPSQPLRTTTPPPQRNAPEPVTQARPSRPGLPLNTRGGQTGETEHDEDDTPPKRPATGALFSNNTTPGSPRTPANPGIQRVSEELNRSAKSLGETPARQAPPSQPVRSPNQEPLPKRAEPPGPPAPVRRAEPPQTPPSSQPATFNSWRAIGARRDEPEVEGDEPPANLSHLPLTTANNLRPAGGPQRQRPPLEPVARPPVKPEDKPASGENTDEDDNLPRPKYSLDQAMRVTYRGAALGNMPVGMLRNMARRHPDPRVMEAARVILTERDHETP